MTALWIVLAGWGGFFAGVLLGCLCAAARCTDCQERIYLVTPQGAEEVRR